MEEAAQDRTDKGDKENNRSCQWQEAAGVIGVL